MTTLIIEDETIAAERLQHLLEQIPGGIKVLAVLDSVQESVQWLRHQPPPDFILLDIHLADGSAFDIFKQVNITAPVIFTTAYDQYAIDAFKVLSIDYLLKPVSADALSAAIKKLRLLRTAVVTATDYERLLGFMQQQATPKYKSRFVGKVGQKLFFLNTNEIAYFTAEKKVVYCCGCDGNLYVVEQTLEELEALLDPRQFFRINRSIIVRAEAIGQVKPFINSRLKIIFKTGRQPEEAIVSRERVGDFKLWANN
ncbi:MAG: response regulator transcription factor [Bacteroidota bacterium]|nr:response regulator transcription factor [Bacteroidota bacterium]